MSSGAAHRESGLHRLLEATSVYRLLQSALGADRVRKIFVERYVRCAAEDRILDVGCGPADLLGHLPESVDYVGFDVNPGYVQAATRRWGGRARFLVGAAGEVDDGVLGGPFDRILLVALLHHLEDDAVRRILAQARRLLAPGGALLTFDNVRTEGQSPIARFLIERDRGARVRTPEAYLELLDESFDLVEWEVRDDLLRVPYSHFIARAAVSR